jgi:hypothetical protein
MTCSVANACTFMSFWVVEFSGMCKTNPCWDVAAHGQGPSGVNSVTLTTPTTNNTNELIVALMQNVNDEPFSAVSPAVAFQSGGDLALFPGNMPVGKMSTTSGSTYSLTGSWTGAADTGYGTIGAIKSAASSNAQCSNTSYGGVATCVQAAGAGGASTNQSSKSISFAPAAGHAVIAAVHECWDSNCVTTGTTTMSIADNVNPSGEACFIPSPHSPFTLVETGAQQVQEYIWVCPAMPAGVSTITINCSVANSCNNITITVSEWTGLATSDPWDVDGGAASTSSATTATVSTSAGARFTNELSYTFLDNSAGEQMTSVAPFVQVEQFYSGNINTALITSGDVSTSQATWSPADDWYGTIGTIKTLQSVPRGPAAPVGLTVKGVQ